MAAQKKAAKKKAAPRKRAAAPKQKASFGSWSPKAMFLESFMKEHATTMKVLSNFPATQGEFRPHPRSQSARQLAFTFVMEQKMISAVVAGTFKLGGGMPPLPDDFGQIVKTFDSDYEALVEQIRKAPDSAFEGTVDFPVGPGKIVPWPKMEFIYMMLRDQIHHRGQYTVYSRMAGGKVPAVYGPSADEPWF